MALMNRAMLACTVILEIGLTYKHTLIVCWPHRQELSVIILLSQPHLNEGGCNFPFIQNMKYMMFFYLCVYLLNCVIYLITRCWKFCSEHLVR